MSRRAKGEPLQYVLGSQPFLGLDLACRKGVLIPRGDTENYTERVAGLVSRFLADRVGGGRSVAGCVAPKGEHRDLRLLDLCTGSGCIPLGLYAEVCGSRCERPEQLEVVGVDISVQALVLARQNLRRNISLGRLPTKAAEQISFQHADVILRTSTGKRSSPSSSSSSSTHSQKHKAEEGDRVSTQSSTTKVPYILDLLSTLSSHDRPVFDILTANPPYISPSHFSSSSDITALSVRDHEPLLALVPDPSIVPHPFGLSSSQGPRPVDGLQTISTAVTDGDQFYHHILPIVLTLNIGLTVLEVGDTQQARRMAGLAGRLLLATFNRGDISHDDGVADSYYVLETWYDDGRIEDFSSCDASGDLSEDGGEPSARAIVIWRRDWAEWRRRMRRRRRRRNNNIW
jgi:methylase of polypeptide subunit release factors